MHAEEMTMLVHTHGTAVYNFCRKLTGSKPDADDLYQETFLKALEHCGKIDMDRNPKAFLLSCALKLWKSGRRMYARRQRLAPSAELTEAVSLADGTDVEAEVISNSVHREVRNAVDALNDKFRVPLYLYYTLEMDVGGIAAMLNIPQGTVKSRLHKARTLIKKRLEANGDEQFGRALV